MKYLQENSKYPVYIKAAFFAVILSLSTASIMIVLHLLIKDIKTYKIIQVSLSIFIIFAIVTALFLHKKKYGYHYNSIKNRLNETEISFRQFFEDSPVAMLMLNQECRITGINHICLFMLHLSEQEIIGENFSSLLTTSSGADFMNNIFPSIWKKGSIKNELIEIQLNKAQMIHVNIDVTVTPDKNNKPIALCALRDITEFRQAHHEKKLLISELEIALSQAKEANNAKSNFLSIISHELKTPLTAMIGFSEIITNDQSLSSEARKYCEIIHRSGKKLLEIISEIIELSVIESQKIKLQHELFNIMEILDELAASLQDYLQKNEIIFRYDEIESEHIYSDRHKVNKILYHLINNAFKFTENGCVDISVRLKETEYLFTVKDTGIGIPENERNNIFEMFCQAEDVYTRKHGGLGLGLTIVQKYVHALGGNIWVEENTPGGSIFSFVLPRNQEKERAAFLEKSLDSETTLPHGKNILVSDDDVSLERYL